MIGVKIIQYLEDRVLELNRPIVAIGNFDGVHLGHQEIFKRVLTRAREIEGDSVVLTFDPHPLFVLAPDQKPSLLSTLGEKKKVIESLGIDYLVLIRFDLPFSQTPPQEFVRKVVKEQLGAEEVFVGYNFTFGHRGEGTPEMLAQWGEEYGCKVTIVEPICVAETPVSSSLIRELIREGRVIEAKRFLGRYPTLEGEVIHGMDRGKRVVGFATANLRPEGELTPKDGVYVCWTQVSGEWIPGVANIGINPTFKDNPYTIEVHLLNFEGDLYGERIEIAFVDRIRDEKVFPNPRSLSERIQKDIEIARKILEESPKP